MKADAPNVLLVLALACELIATFKPTWASKIVVNWMTFGFAFVLAAYLFGWALQLTTK